MLSDLRQETLHCASMIAARTGHEFNTADVSTAILYADLPLGIQLNAEIPRSHEDYHKQKECVLQIYKGLCGLKEVPRLC